MKRIDGGMSRRGSVARVENLENRTLLAASPFDASFGVGGKSKLDVSGLGDRFDHVLVLPDGKLLLGGTSNFGIAGAPTTSPTGQPLPVVREENGVVLRLNADGTPDLTFGGDGVADFLSDPYAYVPWQDVPLHPRLYSVEAIAAQADGKVLAAGFSFRQHAPPADQPQTLPDGTPLYVNDRTFGVVRYNADGTIDRTFGVDGFAQVGFFDINVDGEDGDERVTAMAVQADGKTLVAGTVDRPGGGYRTDPAVFRLNGDGTIDGTFGKRLIDVPDAPGGLQRNALFSTIEVAADGKVLLGGAAAVTVHEDVHSGFAVARLNPDGTRDTTFGDRGFVTTSFPAVPDPISYVGTSDAPYLQQLLLQSGGRIVAVGGLGTAYAAAVRYNADGSIDASFGDAGRVYSRGVVYGQYRAVEEAGGGLAISGVGNGTYMTRAENSVISHDTGPEAYVTQLDASGKVLSAARAEQLPMAGTEWVAAVAVQPDGKVVAVGSANPTAWDPIEHLQDGSASPIYQVHAAATDGLVVRVDPALLTADEAVGRDTGGTGGMDAGAVSMPGTVIVRRGKAAKLRLVFGSAGAARAAAITVSGPNGFTGSARLLKVKARRRGPATATFVVGAPGGTFDAGDNGAYAVRLGTSPDAAPPLGQFTVLVGKSQRRR